MEYDDDDVNKTDTTLPYENLKFCVSLGILLIYFCIMNFPDLRIDYKELTDINNIRLH